MPDKRKWRVLIVEDDPAIGPEIVEGLQSPDWLDADTSFEAQLVSTFVAGMAALGTARFDLIVLDLKDDAQAGAVDLEEDKAKPGLDILQQIRKTRFVPVVFYTALPQQVSDLKSVFVRVIEKTEGMVKVREEIKSLLETKLPFLSRYLEEQQRKYFWDFVETEWRDGELSGTSVDLAYLMARRLAAALRSEFSRAAASEIGGADAAPADTHDIHPMDTYIFPPVDRFWSAGDILRRKGTNDYFAVVTPTCDFAQGKANYFVTAKCQLLTAFDAYTRWSGAAVPPTFAGNSDRITELMKDNQGQKDRYKYLPGTSAFPDLVVDLQQLSSVELSQQGEFDRIASMDSPFAETLLARFARFYGRIATPDLDLALAMARAKSRATNAAGARE